MIDIMRGLSVAEVANELDCDEELVHFMLDEGMLFYVTVDGEPYVPRWCAMWFAAYQRSCAQQQAAGSRASTEISSKRRRRTR